VANYDEASNISQMCRLAIFMYYVSRFKVARFERLFSTPGTWIGFEKNHG
jgi:hypothetical protein